MKKLYMGADGELFETEGAGRVKVRILDDVTQEFACFRDAWYKSKINRLNDKGFLALSKDDMDMMKLYNSRPKVDTTVKEAPQPPKTVKPSAPRGKQVKFRLFGEKN